MAVSRCHCGVAADSAAARCNSCPQVGSPGLSSSTPSGAGSGPRPSGFVPQRAATGRPASFVQPGTRYSRWAKSQNSFGPFGRVVATIALLAPLVILAVTVVTGIGIIGAGIYAIVFVPWGLKDIWKRTKITVGPAGHAHRR